MRRFVVGQRARLVHPLKDRGPHGDQYYGIPRENFGASTVVITRVENFDPDYKYGAYYNVGILTRGDGNIVGGCWLVYDCMLEPMYERKRQKGDIEFRCVWPNRSDTVYAQESHEVKMVTDALGPEATFIRGCNSILHGRMGSEEFTMLRVS